MHRVDQYARDVLEGRIVAGPLVRLACERHERDIAEASVKGFYFDAEAADHTIGFIERWVRLFDTMDEDGQPKRFILQPWQAFIVGSLFGWRWTESGHRRFRNGFIEIGKGNGKTPMLAAIGLYGLMMDGQRAPEVYAAAADRDQAMIMYRDAVRMVDASPELSKRIIKSGIQHVHNMSYGLGFFRAFSREQSAKSGTRPHFGLIDEVHEHPNADIVNKIRAGAKGNQNAMFLEITNSGFDRTSICYEHHEHSRKIVERRVEDERWFCYVCTLDAGDDPLTDESCHIKVNPNLGVSIHREYLRDQVSAAKHIQAETNTVLRLNFCVWTQARSAFFDRVTWDQCPSFKESELVGAPCYGAFDLGQSDDFTAWARLWLLSDGRVAVRCRYWLPESALTKYPERSYAQWKRLGVLTVTHGNTTDLDLVERTIVEDCRSSGVIEVAYDAHFADHIALHLEGAGIARVNTPQGFALNKAIRKVSDWVVEGKLAHNNDPILAWMADNAVVIVGTKNGDYRLDKQSSREKIDGIVALVMAASRAMMHQPRAFQMLVLGAT